MAGLLSRRPCLPGTEVEIYDRREGRKVPAKSFSVEALVYGGPFDAIPSLGYKSLSSSSYAFKACALYQETGEDAYLEKAREVMDHHGYKGARCSGDIWCPGCNFRILQYLDYLDDLERNGTAATKDRP